MPIYEYQCEECGVRFEQLQSMSAAPVSSCPECGGSVHRIISPVGVVFKGSGFYVTDNRSSSGGRSRSTKLDSESSDSSSKDGGDKPVVDSAKPDAGKES